MESIYLFMFKCVVQCRYQYESVLSFYDCPSCNKWNDEIFVVILEQALDMSCVSWISENGEDIQVLRYEHGQKYDPHYDYFADKVNIARGGHRIATVLMYLTDVTKGGETVFPEAEVSSSIHCIHFPWNFFIFIIAVNFLWDALQNFFKKEKKKKGSYYLNS